MQHERLSADSTFITPAELSGHRARRYDLDWLRVIAILTLLFYHTGMIYVSWPFHIKSEQRSLTLEYVMLWLHYWRMPLLFLISGAGTYYALRKSPNQTGRFSDVAWANYGPYLRERFRRLFIPLVFGMLLIVPPQMYIEKISRGEFTGSFADYYVTLFAPIPKFRWFHLWFLLYLFLYSVGSLPVWHYLRSERGQRLADRVEEWLGRPHGVWRLIGPLLLGQLILKPIFPDDTHRLIDDWAYFLKTIMLFWAGYLFVSRPVYARLLTQNRRTLLAYTVGFSVLMYICYALYTTQPALKDNLVLLFCFGLTTDVVMCFAVLVTLAYSYHYLNRDRPVLKHLNEAVYPFYMLHQTAIIVIGYFVLQWIPTIWGSFLVISLSTLVVCVLLYILLVRPFKATRFLFGLK